MKSLTYRLMTRKPMYSPGTSRPGSGPLLFCKADYIEPGRGIDSIRARILLIAGSALEWKEGDSPVNRFLTMVRFFSPQFNTSAGSKPVSL